MSHLSIHFAKALAAGRRAPQGVQSRERQLCTLLRKRATASRIGDVEMEQLLRAQILWSLPTQYGGEDMIIELEAA